MARIGITYRDVENAASELVAKNQNPTIEKVRHILGTGSSTTIAKYLRQWKDRQDDLQLIASKERIPEPLVVSMKGLWESVCQEAESQVVLIRKQAAEEHQLLNQQLQKVSQEREMLQREYARSKQAINALHNDKLAQEQAIIKLQNELSQLTSNHHISQQRLTDKQEQTNDLKRLNQQLQENLDHYRESSREQRIAEQQHYEQRIKALECTNLRYLKENNELKNQTQKLYTRLDKLQSDFNQLQSNHQDFKNRFTLVKEKLNTEKKQLAIIKDENVNMQADLQESNHTIKEQEKIIIDAQQQITLLSSTLKATETKLNDAQHQSKLLAHDKWVLGQEKARLLGQLHQIEAANQ